MKDKQKKTSENYRNIIKEIENDILKIILLNVLLNYIIKLLFI